MKDGRCWMAENLRYVPAGMTVSDDPAEDTGIWYAKMEKRCGFCESVWVFVQLVDCFGRGKCS